MTFQRPQAHGPKKRRRLPVNLVIAGVVFVALSSTAVYGLSHISAPSKPQTKTSAVSAQKGVAATASVESHMNPAPAPNYCAANTLSQNVLVSISKRHLWACENTKTVFDSAVVTGMENIPSDLTPTGTYHIYAKQTNLYLNGSDSTGSWHDYVYYWMPWLNDQYGIYGFHDATWRDPSAFGNIDPYSKNASHGCVELPLATAKWLYNWSSVGTTVTIES